MDEISSGAFDRVESHYHPGSDDSNRRRGAMRRFGANPPALSRRERLRVAVRALAGNCSATDRADGGKRRHCSQSDYGRAAVPDGRRLAWNRARVRRVRVTNSRNGSTAMKGIALWAIGIPIPIIIILYLFHVL